MKNMLKKILVLVLALTLALTALVGTASADGNFKPATIGVALYFDTGYYPENVKSYLSALGEAMNVKFVYTVLTQTDESANLTKIQELIGSGVDGIILTLDMGTQAILNECRDADVYVAGFLCDFNTSYTTNYDAVFKNEYFLGTVSDGPCGDDLRAGYDYFDSLMEYNERHPEAPITHVSMTTFPAWAFPVQQLFVQQFTEKVEAYNQTAATPITVDPLDEATDVLMFQPLDSTYFSKHPGIDAIMSFCDGSTFVYPTMVSAGMEKTIKLFSAGYGEGDSANFGSRGTGTFQQQTVSAIEAVAYPIVLLVNKINGVEFPDMPENAERVSCFSIIINSDEDMVAFEHCLYLTGKLEDALYSAEDVANMTAVANPDATYAGLVSIMDKMTVEYISK
ncbi:MAG: hypothetical protein IJ662_06360 [Clostridia bacterium]|nr:hypothetical protein [Clostridia bacterium]